MSHSLFILAGEASGDYHGARLALALRQRQPDIALAGMGGHWMREAGVEVIHDVTALAAVGITEVLGILRRINRVFHAMIAELERRHPDAVVLIDYPAFNLRFARWAHERGVRVVYYICPQVWAWHQSRVTKIRRYTDKRLVILPFEPAFYARHGVEATFVGHPLLDSLATYRQDRRFAADLGLPADTFILGLLPGSRKSEVHRLLPAMLGAADRIARELGNVTVATAPAPSLGPDEYSAWARRASLPLHILPGKARELMAASDLLLIASGTATLEAGIIGTPMIVTYKVAPFTAFLAWLLVRGVRHISLANLVAGREIVPELLQGKATPRRIARKAIKLIRSGGLEQMGRELVAEVRPRLGEPGAAGRAADEVLALLRRDG
ncbi:MAG TPA: lipid-A-disaccharide synthase [Planctomycetota bacterium]|nr:lipid-A-disaccharide synthase [Planctomycetota bacterium]HRR82884.1 lipid-A-disaccharide synthase [Planctomycetota bacterium]HRT94548.1 lipid-A-disaccharide synthase [Planctomycetota bacterium]